MGLFVGGGCVRGVLSACRRLRGSVVRDGEEWVGGLGRGWGAGGFLLCMFI